MQYWYTGQTRRYILQIIRLLSNFSVRQSDGTLIRVPVMYGDIDRQVANIINQNSENTVNSSPRIAVYISEIELDRDRLCDATHVGKIHIRERGIEDGEYTGDQGSNYTIERLMPTPYKLTVKADIWSSSNDQKLQIFEQILMFFNPSLEIQTSDNYVDWTSLSVVDLIGTNFSSRSIPVGTGTSIDIATLSLQTPIWISPPAKVKKMGIITSVIATLYDDVDPGDGNYSDGLGTSLGIGDSFPLNPIAARVETIGNYDIIVNGKNVIAISNNQNSQYVSWYHIVEQYPGDYQPGLAKIFLIQPDDTEVIGFGTINMLDETIMTISDWDSDTFPANTLISGPTRLESAWGSFDAVVDPQQTKPKNLVPGTRYLLVNGIGGGVRDTFITTDHIDQLVTNVAFSKVNYYTLTVDGNQINSEPLSNPIYTNITPSTITGSGVGASFDVTINLSTNSYIVSIVDIGYNYNVGDKLKIRGNHLDGNVMENDCIITVMAVDSNGSLINVRSSGTALSRNFTIVPDLDIQSGSEVSYELFMNVDGPDAWKNIDGSDFIAESNDIIEWDGARWYVIFNSDEISELTYQTNLHTLVQYKFNGDYWQKSFEGEYERGKWRMIL